MSAKESTPIDTLSLSPKDRRALIDSMEADRLSQTKVASNRRGVRVAFNIGTIVIAVTQPSGHMVRYAVAPRNLSTRGLAFIHGRFLYKNSPVQVILPDVNRETIQTLTGSVLESRHIGGLIHEVSVKFDKPMDLRRFVRLSEEQASRSRREIGGKALVIGEQSSIRQLNEFLLAELGLTVSSAASIEAAVREIGTHAFDLVLSDLSDAAEGPELCKKLREAEFSGMIVVLGETNGDPEEAAALDAGANSFLSKPIDMNKLRYVIEQLLTSTAELPTGSAIHSPLSSNPRMVPIVKAFVEELQTDISKMQHAMYASNRSEVYKVVQHVRGPASSYGYKPLSVKAKTVMEALVSKSATEAEWRAQVEQLIQIARRIRP